MPVAIAAAQVDGAGNAAGAVRELEALRAEAVTRGFSRYEFEARRAIARIEGRGSADGARLSAGISNANRGCRLT